MNKKFYLITLLFFIINFSLVAQHTQWLHSKPVAYSLNPDLPQSYIDVSGNKVFVARLDSSTLNFGLDVFGRQVVECYDTLGNINWSFYFDGTVAIDQIKCDQLGNVYVAGNYMNTLKIGANDSLLNTGTGFDINYFICCVDVNGSLVWKRNLTLTYPNLYSINDIEIDNSNNSWMAIQDFSEGYLIKLDSSGNEVLTYQVNGIRSLSTFSFDAQNNIYFTGSAQTGTISFNGISETVTHVYAMYLGRISNTGIGSWVRIAHDATFQNPKVCATINGDAYLCGSIFDTTSWGTISFQAAQWVYARQACDERL